ncbi:hypothetical protein [Winogradskyella sp.]|uniref:hypothetical protein n=1 Tax=Winogradskyella sp. TaxID=1883156 RepID=UPI002602ED93|nr:hypothetical protein [Winogradskyella sp.]
MNKKHILHLFLICFVSLFQCCSNTDDNTTPLITETTADNVVLAQNSNVEIFIFDNDVNIPQTGTLSISLPSLGIAQIQNNNTPDNPSDDYVIYTPNPNVVGGDMFQYTICGNLDNCITEEVSIIITSSSVVNIDIENLPYDNLSEYNFFQGDLKDLDPSFGVVPYTLNSTLFSDYAKKKRFIWMPNNTKATYINDDVPLEFPIGTILIKNFYYDKVIPDNNTRILETRLMINKSDGWIFANYVWNNEQNEAYLDMGGSFVNLEWTQNGELNSVQYRIPAGPECHTCHKVMEVPKPIGPKPRNLNLEYDYSDGLANQLDKLISLGYLDSNTNSQSISRLPNYNDTSEPLELRVRAYLDINCAHCHSEETHCAYRPMRFGYNDSEDLTNIGVCVEPDTDLGLGLGDIVMPGDPLNSVLFFRLSTLEESYRMPLMGRSLRHEEGVDLVEQWIDQLSIQCE